MVVADGASPTRLERLVRANEENLLPPQRLATLMALAIALGPGASSTSYRHKIEKLLTQGVIAPDADLRVSLRRLPGTWSADDAEKLRVLAGRINGREVASPQPASILDNAAKVHAS